MVCTPDAGTLRQQPTAQFLDAFMVMSESVGDRGYWSRLHDAHLMGALIALLEALPGSPIIRRNGQAISPFAAMHWCLISGAGSVRPRHQLAVGRSNFWMPEVSLNAYRHYSPRWGRPATACALPGFGRLPA